jgi:cardiolipin synthase
MNIPNMLTALRLILVPVFLLVFFSGHSHAILFSFIIFCAAGLTDVLDGYIARKYNMVTKWGSVLDPLADKLMSITVLLSLTIRHMIPEWVLLVIGAKELLMIAGGIFLFKKGTYVPAQIYGKAASVLFYVSILVLQIEKTAGLIFIYITVFVALFALYKYFENFVKIRKEEKLHKEQAGEN